MIEKEYITPLDLTPDEPQVLKKPILFKIGFIFALLGLATPFLVFLAARFWLGLPCCGEDSNPADGIGWMLVMMGGIAWWTITEIISFVFTISGFARKETGRIKLFAIVASGLSMLLIVLIYAAAIALVTYSSRT